MQRAQSKCVVIYESEAQHTKRALELEMKILGFGWDVAQWLRVSKITALCLTQHGRMNKSGTKKRRESRGERRKEGGRKKKKILGSCPDFLILLVI